MYIFICPLPKGLLKAITLKTLTCSSFILPMSSVIFQILVFTVKNLFYFYKAHEVDIGRFIQIESHFKTTKCTQ